MKPVYFTVNAQLTNGDDTTIILAVVIKKLGNNQLQIITDHEGCLHEDSNHNPFDLENTTLTFIGKGVSYTFSKGEELKFTFCDGDGEPVTYDNITPRSLRKYTIHVAKMKGSEFYLNEATLTALPISATVLFDGEDYVLSD